MRAMVGREEPVDPPVLRRPLPFSRAWLAAFVLGVIAVGWTAIVVEFDGRAERAHVERLRAVVGDMERALVSEEGYRLVRGTEDLIAITAARPDSGAEELDRIWNRVEILTTRAEETPREDLQSFTDIVARLRTASSELEGMVGETDSGPGLFGS